MITAAGLPYPVPTDAWTDTDRFIRELAQAIDYRIANPGRALFSGTVDPDGNGDSVFAFPQLAAVSGAVAFPWGNAVGAVQAIAGTNVTVRWWYVSALGGGYYPAAQTGPMKVSVLAWGTAK